MQYVVTFLLAIISSMLIDNVVLSRFYGICPFLGVSDKPKSALGMGLAVIFVIVLSTIICWPLFELLKLAEITFLDTVVYILVIIGINLINVFTFKKGVNVE